MRTTNSIRNAIIAVWTNITTMLVGIVAQAVFIRILGKEYLGINSLFSNIIYMLSIVESGIGTAIIYNLYKPVSENDNEKIKSLLKFYKRAYEIIGIVIFFIGLIILPFLNIIVNNVLIDESIHVIFVLFLLDSAFSYFLTYKRSILYATQETYIINIIHIGYILLMNLISSILLVLFKEYYIYLFSKIIFRVLENTIINIVVNKKYSYVREKEVEKIKNEEIKSLISKIKALFFHKIGEIMLLGTDSIIISKFLGIIWVGMYSNYNMIINAISGVFGQVFSAITASVGNLLVEEDDNKTYEVYKKMILFNFWFSTLCSVLIFGLMEPFIKVWIGEEYLLSTVTLFLLVLVFYMQTMKKTLKVFKEASGKFEKDRYIPIIESLVNIIVSIMLVKKIGLIGVFVGTLASTLILYMYSFPRLVYKDIFNKNYKTYLLEYTRYFIILLVIIIISYVCIKIIHIENSFWQLIANSLICIILPNIILYIMFGKTEEFYFYKKLMADFIKKRRKNI